MAGRKSLMLGLFIVAITGVCNGTLEDAGNVPEELDPLQMAQTLLQQEGYQLQINRTSIRFQGLLGLDQEDSHTAKTITEMQWSECSAVLIIAPCGIASTLADWLAELSINYKPQPSLLVFEPDQLPCDVTAEGALILAGTFDTAEAIVKTLLRDGLDWRKLILIHDNSLSPVQRSIIRLALAECSIQVQALEMNLLHKNGHFGQGLLAALRTDQEHHIMLALTESALSEILQQAEALDLLQPHHYWVLLSPTSCAAALGPPVTRESNVLQLVRTHTLHGGLTQPQCPSHMLEGLVNSTVRMSHLLASGIYTLLSMREYLVADEIQLSTCGISRTLLTGPINQTPEKISVWTADGNVTFDRATGHLESSGFQVCSTDMFSPVGYSQVARWSTARGISKVDGPLYRNVFRDFSNIHDRLIVSTREAPPYVMKVQSGSEITYEGLCIDILDELAAQLFFNYTIVEVEDQRWGSMDENQQWNGVVAEVMNEKALIGVGPISLMTDREKVVDYTTPFGEDGTSFMTLKPGRDKNAVFQLFRPFQPLVWLFLVLLASAFMAAIFVVERTSPVCHQRRSVVDCIWAVYGFSVGQGTAFDLSSTSARLVLGTFWVVIIIVTSSYTADLAAVLTVNTREEPMASLSQLASQSAIMPIIERGSNLETLFFSATSGVYRDIAQMMSDMPEVTNANDAVKMVEERNMAYLSDMSQVDYIVGEQCDKFARAEAVFNTGGIGFIVPKNAPYLQAFNGIIVKLLEAGILAEWRRKWWTHHGQTCKPEARVSTGRNLGMMYLAGPFFVFTGASGLGLLLALAEWAWRTEACYKLRTRLQLRSRLQIFKRAEQSTRVG